eukprot:m.37297 g.37297  ORF g.37297 m.37297 type:complete len:123 (-) comp44961_c0_seq8:337-705(-)
MAIKEMQKLCAAVRKQHDLIAIYIAHRLGCDHDFFSIACLVDTGYRAQEWSFVFTFGVCVLRRRLVPVREASVIIAVSSKHRKDCMNAVQFLIDTLKATVPIWKKVSSCFHEPQVHLSRMAV